MIEHALTIDVEDWYQVENFRHVAPPERWESLPSRLERNMLVLFDLLAEHDVRATFFVLGMAAQRHPQVVREIVDRGHELACHGWAHELVYRQSPSDFRAETRRARDLLEDLSGRAIHGYRASTFSITNQSLWALDILAEEGFAYDSSIAPLRHDRYGIPSAPRVPHVRSQSDGRRLVEFPLSCARLFGWDFPLGGGFFRLFPLRWAAKALRRHEARRQSAVIYLHPWEFDPEQPRLQGVGWMGRFRHYVGISRTRGKLAALLGSFRFTTARKVLQGVFGPEELDLR